MQDVARLYGEKRDLILMDNNVVASARFKEIIAEIRDLGYAGSESHRASLPRLLSRPEVFDPAQAQ